MASVFPTSTNADQQKRLSGQQVIVAHQNGQSPKA
jgi:hypothetical protein